MKVLGINDGADAGAALIQDGKIISAINEERLSRIKLHEGHIHGFPVLSINKVLEGHDKNSIDFIAFGSVIDPIIPVRLYGLYSNSKKDSPVTKIDISKKSLFKLSSSYLLDYFWNMKSNSLFANVSKSIYKKFVEKVLNKKCGLNKIPIKFVDHHSAHVASAYYSQKYEDCTVISVDGHGDGISSSVYTNTKNGLKRIISLPSRSSAGWFYGAVTNYLGFRQHRHEGKVTGLAAYGNPNLLYNRMREALYYDTKKNTIVNNLGPKFVGMYNIAKYIKPESTKEDVAAAAQKVLEDTITPFVKQALNKTNIKNVALVGGIFANVKLNQRIHELKDVTTISVFPNMGDGGVAVGAALFICCEEMRKQNQSYKLEDLKDVYFGPEYNNNEIKKQIDILKVKNYEKLANIERKTAELISKGKVIARFNGKMEYGPRALGNRSIMYHTKDKKVNDWLNKRLKRTEFMPFAPVTLDEKKTDCYLNLKGIEEPIKYMTISLNCTNQMSKQSPAVVHVDNTARPQIINPKINKSYYQILKEYYKISGIPSLVNTSFNMHEEPIVCSPYDAIRSFQSGNLDYLAIGDYIIWN
jgi:carbamoyltransferase